MRADEAVDTPPRADDLASVESGPTKTQPPAGVEPAADTAPSPDKPASAFGTLRGRVIDAITRKPVREFELAFDRSRAIRAGEVPDARGFRTVDGRFAWESLPTGRWTITASARGYQRFELIGLEIERGQATPEIVLPLRAGHTLRGRLYDEVSGAGIASANVGFRESDTGRFEGNFRARVRVTSAKDGSFILDGVPPGRVTLEISAQDYAGVEHQVVVGDETPPLEIGLSTGGAIAGQLTAADGVTPVAGSAGLFHLDQGFGGTSRTGEAGEFSFQNLSPGRYRLTGQAPEGSVTREVVLAKNQRMEGIVLALSAGRSIRGVVTGLRPEDMRQVRISLTRDGDATHFDASVGLDDHGAYALHGVQPGRVRVVADVTMRRQLSRTVEMPANSDIMVNLDFPSGARLSGRLTRGGKPLAGAWLMPRSMGEQAVFIYGTVSSNDGKYVIEGLPTGEYAVMVGDYRSGPVQVSGDTTFDIDVPLVQLSGRVLEEGSKAPVVGADVELWPAEPGARRIRLHDRSDHFGRFGLAGLEPGDFMLSVYKPGHEMRRTRISYTLPIADMTISLRQEAGVPIRVREAGSGEALQQIFATEMIGDHTGSRLQLRLDDDGVGYIPAALSGSTLSFSAVGYAPAVISGWDGQRLDLQLERTR
jgi:protocatechuate 3,4-dioxygenase beta subunit